VAKAVASRAVHHLLMPEDPRIRNVRLMLVQRRDTVAPRDQGTARVRRYRLARVDPDGRATDPARHSHLKRMYD
jgi:hypothetical protein